MNKTTETALNQQVLQHPVVFEMNGSDAMTFLNNQTLTDLPKHRGQLIYTGICNPKGRLLFSLFIKQAEDAIHLAVDASLGDNFLQYVAMRRFRMDYEIKKSDQHLNFNHQAHQPTVADDVFFTNADGAAVAADDFWRLMFKLNLPWITADTAEAFIPQHLNLEQHGIIDFDKGCYPGQEIVARLHFLGKVKKQMRLITYPSPKPLAANELRTLAEMAGLEDLCSPAIDSNSGWSCQAVFKI